MIDLRSSFPSSFNAALLIRQHAFRKIERAIKRLHPYLIAVDGRSCNILPPGESSGAAAAEIFSGRNPHGIAPAQMVEVFTDFCRAQSSRGTPQNNMFQT